MSFRPENKRLSLYAKELRKNQTPTEIILWSHIRKKRIKGIQFYRQKVIGNFIADFFAPTVNLVIELDGSQHYEPNGLDADLSRDSYLSDLGLHVMRFSNLEVFNELECVLAKIYDYITFHSRSE